MKLSFKFYSVFLPVFCFLFVREFHAQQFSPTKFDFETRLFNRDNRVTLTSALETGGELSLAEHFKVSAGINLYADDMLNFFHAAEAKKKPAELELAFLAAEFPFNVGGRIVPALFTGNYANLSSGDLLFRTLRTRMNKPEFIKRGPMEIFSDDTETSGLGAAFMWTAETVPVAVAAYSAWNAETDNPGYNVFAQTAGAGRTLLWNIYAGVEKDGTETGTGGLYLSAGLSAEAGAERPFSLYMQTKILPFDLMNGESLVKNLEKKVHFMLEPRFNGNLFSVHAAFFISPVLAVKEVPYMDINDEGQYLGMNLRFTCGTLLFHKQNLGFDFTMVSDTDKNSDDNSKDIIFLISPFFNIAAGGSVITFSISLNPAKITSPFSAGEINLHIEAAL